MQRVNEANAEVAKFNAMYAEYVKNPEVTKKRMFYETMEDVLPQMKVIIDGTDKTDMILPLDNFFQSLAGNTDSQNAESSRVNSNAMNDSDTNHNASERNTNNEINEEDTIMEEAE